jgi:hypothetical protein
VIWEERGKWAEGLRRFQREEKKKGERFGEEETPDRRDPPVEEKKGEGEGICGVPVLDSGADDLGPGHGHNPGGLSFFFFVLNFFILFSVLLFTFCILDPNRFK